MLYFEYLSITDSNVFNCNTRKKEKNTDKLCRKITLEGNMYIVLP